MRKILKISAYLAILVFVSGLLGFFALKHYFTPDKIKKIIIDYASKNMEREISMDSASLKLSGFAIKNLKISESPNFKAGEFLRAKEFILMPNIRALLKKKIKIDSVSVKGLKLNIVEVRKNTYNFSDLTDKQTSAPTPKQKPKIKSRKMDLSISNLNVSNSLVFFKNSAGSFTLKDINLKTANITPRDAFPYQASSIMVVNTPYFKGELPISLSGDLEIPNLNIERGKINIDSANISLGEIKCSIKGNLQNFSAPSSELHIEVKPFSTTNLKPYFPEIPSKFGLPGLVIDTNFKIGPGYLKIRKTSFEAAFFSGNLSGSLKLEPTLKYAFNLNMEANTPELNSSAIAKRFPAIPKNVRVPMLDIKAKTLLRNNYVAIKRAEIISKKSQISLTAGINLSKKGMRVKGQTLIKKGDIAEISKIFPDLKKYSLSGTVGGRAVFSYAKKTTFNGSVKFKDVRGESDAFKASDLKGTISFSDKKIAIKKLSGNINESPLKADFSVADYMTHPKARFDILLSKLELPAIKPASKKASPAPAKKTPADNDAKLMDIKGTVSIGEINHPNFHGRDIFLKAALKNLQSDWKNISGNASFNAVDGKLSNLYGLAKDYKAAKITLYPILLFQESSKVVKLKGLPNFDNINYSLINGDYSFRNGTMEINKSNLKSDIADVKTSGKINLVSEKLDIRLSARMHRQSGISMSSDMDWLVTGTLSDPKVKPDIKSITKQPAIKKVIDKGAKKLLKSLFR